MRKIIRRKVYDTSTAKEVGSVEKDITNRLFYIINTLYRKSNGEYFLYCEGGPGTPLAEPEIGGGFTSGAIITPLTYETAQKWAEENLTAQEYEAEFTVLKESSYRLNVDITLAEKIKLEKYTRDNNLGSLSASIRKLINEECL